jgi:hypothetical protein
MVVDILSVISLAIFFEVLTTFLRFGFNLESRRLQIKEMHFPFRVHHMYFGLGFMFLGAFWSPPILNDIAVFTTVFTLGFLEIGLALILSDLFHHFVILPAFHKKRDFP